MVLTLLVTSSPTAPSPLVAAEIRIPFSYLRLIARPSILSSQRKLVASTRLAQAVSSSWSKALSKLHMRSRCSTGANASLAFPPTLWVGLSPVMNSGCSDSSSSSSCINLSYSASLIRTEFS